MTTQYKAKRFMPGARRDWRAALRTDDFSADAAAGIDFQQQRVPVAAVDDVDLAYALFQGLHAGLQLRDHSGVDHLVVDQLLSVGDGQRANDRGRIVLVAADAVDVAQEN